jgi:hypothetical protein
MIRATRAFNMEFNSASEYACATMLEKYANWRPIPGATVEIKVGRTLFDFRVDDVFVEYHPISLRREFITDALKGIMSVANKLSRKDKLQIMDNITEELKAQYAKRRGQTLAAHPVYSQMELVCIHSIEEFIDKVLRRFATREVSSTEVAAQEFRKLQKIGKRLGINQLHAR